MMRRKICAVLLAVLTLSLPVRSFASSGAAEKAAPAERAAFEEEAEEIVWESVWEEDSQEGVSDSPWESAADTAALMDDPPDAAPTSAATPTPSAVTPSPASSVTPTPSTVTPDVLYTVTVTGGSGSGRYHPGETITVAMDPVPEGMRLKSVNHTKDVTFTRVAGAERVTYTFVMPAFDVTVRAVYEEDVYEVVVTGGGGSGKYHPGDTVDISAYPPPDGKRLWGWQHISGFKINFAESTGSAKGSFEMPSKNVWLAAVYTDTTGGRQWMRLDGNKVIVSAVDAGKQNLQGYVLLAACTQSGQMLSTALDLLPETQTAATASLELKLTKADSVTAFFLDDAWRPVVGKITVPIPSSAMPVPESTTG